MRERLILTIPMGIDSRMMREVLRAFRPPPSPAVEEIMTKALKGAADETK